MKRSLKTILKKAKRIPSSLRSQLLKAFGKSDKKRWEKSTSFYESWDERTRLLVAPIKPHSTVLEFGAGRLVVENMLPEQCTYLHSDIVKRREDTLVLDLNETLPVFQSVDYMIFSGVLEYVKDIPKLLEHCSKYTSHMLLSYAGTDKIASKKERRYHGWISDLSHEDILHLAKTHHFDIQDLGVWQQQQLYHFKKKIKC